MLEKQKAFAEAFKVKKAKKAEQDKKMYELRAHFEQAKALVKAKEEAAKGPPKPKKRAASHVVDGRYQVGARKIRDFAAIKE